MLFTKRLTLEKPIIFQSNKERIININTFSLETSDDSKLPLEIFCINKRKKETFKICSLKKGSNEFYTTNINLDIHNFQDKYEIKLQTKSKNAVINIYGFYEEEEEDEEVEGTKKEAENNQKSEIKKEKNDEKEEKEIKSKKKDKIKDIKKKEKNEIKDIEVKKETKKKDLELEEDNEEDKIEKNIKEKKLENESNSESPSDSDDNENEILEDNGPSVSLIDLLNKKRKEEPQDLKPMTLKNLSSPEDKKAKEDNKNKKKKIDNNLNNDKKKEIKKIK